MVNKGASLAPDRELGRFTLTDLVREQPRAQVWRAVDSTLAREVSLCVMGHDPSLELELEQATRTAAAITDRRIVRILDLFRTGDLLVVVSEWVAGEALGDHLNEPLPPVEAARIAYEVAGALESAHAAGIVHGRLRPSSVLVCDDGEVRLTGLGVDAVLAGLDTFAGGEPVAEDINGVGSLLFASLTGRWPGAPVEELPAAQLVGGQTPGPSSLLAEIPDALDEACSRMVHAIRAPRDAREVTSMSQARDILGATLTDLT